MALSELNGFLMIVYLSQVLSFLTAFLMAMGLRARVCVLGSLNVTLVQTFCFLAVWAPFLTAEAACLALCNQRNTVMMRISREVRMGSIHIAVR